MMRKTNRLIALIICACMICGLLSRNYVKATVSSPKVSETDLHRYSIKCANTESDRCIFEVVEYSGKYYATLEDICELTGYSIVTDSPKASTHSVISKGLRRVGISKTDGAVLDNFAQDYSHSVAQIILEDEYYCELIPMLKYLGAKCSSSNGALVAAMPRYDLWEVLSASFDFPAFLASIDINNVIDGDIGFHLSMDMLMDLFDVIDGHGLLGVYDETVHKKDALYEILRSDPDEYGSVRKLKGEEFKKVNRLTDQLQLFTFESFFNQSFHLSSNQSGDWKKLVENLPDSFNAAGSLTKEVAKYLIDNDIGSIKRFGSEAFELLSENGKTEIANELAREISSRTLELEDISYSIETVSNAIDFATFALDVGVESYHMMQFDYETKNLFSKGFSDELLKYSQHDGGSEWIMLANEITAEIRNKPSIIATNAYECLREELASCLIEEGVSDILKKGFEIGNSGLYVEAIKAAFLITSSLYSSDFEGASADMNAIYIYLSMNDILGITMSAQSKCVERGFTNKNELEITRNSLLLFYRAWTAYCENLAVSCENLGGKRGKNAAKYFREVADMMAALYHATSLSSTQTIKPISSYTDDVMETVEKSKVSTANINAGTSPCVVTSSDSTFAIKNDGSLWAWGDNAHGELGTGDKINATTPTRVLSNVSTIVTGIFCTYAITNDNVLWAWGRNDYGVLGDGTTNESPIPMKVLEDVKSVSVGLDSVFAIKLDGTLWAWGQNNSGKLGDGTTTDRHTPVFIMNDVASVTSYYGTYAIKNDGTLWSWGRNTNGQLGTGTTQDSHRPRRILDNIVSVSTGTHCAYAVDSSGSLYAWGSNEHGQLGDGSTVDRHSPVFITDGIREVVGSAEDYFTHAITDDGTLLGWGWNVSGQLGDDTTTDRYSPTKIMDNTIKVVQSYTLTTYAIDKDYRLYGWGYNQGLLGDGTSDGRKKPWGIDLNGVVDVVTNDSTSSYAVTMDGSLWAWGWNESGQIGDGTTENKLYPVKIMDGVKLQPNCGIEPHWVDFINARKWRDAYSVKESMFFVDWSSDGVHDIKILLVDLDNDSQSEFVVYEHYFDIVGCVSAWKYKNSTNSYEPILWDEETYPNNDGYQCGHAYYSEKYNAIVVTVGRAIGGGRYYTYYGVDNGALVSLYGLWTGYGEGVSDADPPEWTDNSTGERTIISRDMVQQIGDEIWNNRTLIYLTIQD